jgi:3'(2'), 5'-bisphosphate nucleotidase
MLSNETVVELLPHVVAIARQAGEAILEVYNSPDFDTSYKDDRSPLTRADLESNAVIVQGLQALNGSVPILSEESKAISFAEREPWQQFWLVDPLDGTKEFIKRNGEFTVNIALIENGKPVLGVVHVPVQETTYWGAAGKGAFRQVRDGEAAPIRVTHGPDSGDRPLKVVASRSHANADTQAFLAKLEGDRSGGVDVVSAGSSLKLCLVASGEAQLYPRFGPTMEWDTAAAQCVVEQAGGAVQNVSGEPLRYNKSDLLNPYFIVTDASGLDWQKYAS